MQVLHTPSYDPAHVVLRIEAAGPGGWLPSVATPEMTPTFGKL